MSVLDVHPALPPSELIRAAQARLLARLEAEGVGSMARVGAPGEPVGDRYEFGEVVAVGGLGVIRRAYDRRLGRTVAVKELRRSDPDAERRFLLEAAITARLQHPSIVPLYDIGRFPTGEPYYCMKLVEGRSLELVIRDAGTLQARLALLVHVLAAADAIAHAHRHGVIHRDLKPANILVGEHGETVVIDWGLAKDTTGEIADDLLAHGDRQSEGAEATMTDVGAVLGTLRYMPPEQARGESVDARSDVFALGAVLFHVLAGRPPHEAFDRAALLERLRRDQVELLRPLVPEAPPDLVAIAQKAMSPAPGDRYLGAEAFAEDLRRFLAGRLVDAHRYGPGDLLRVWLRRHRAVAAVVGVSVLALAASSLMFVVNLRAERDVAEDARRAAETAQREAQRRADEAVLAQARATLGDDLHASLKLLTQVDLADEHNLRRARLIALAAEARGAPDRVLRGPRQALEHIAPLSDGNLVGVDGAGGVWRWDVETGVGVQVADVAAPGGQIVSAAEAPVWVVLGGGRGLIFRGEEPAEPFDLGPAGVAKNGLMANDYRWELSRHGEVLAALGTNSHTNSRRRAAAYLWDLTTRPALLRTLPFDHVSTAALSPDGAVVALVGHDRQTVLVEGDRVTPLPELRKPRRFSPSGRFLLGDVAWSLADRTSRPLGGATVLAVTQDDVALVYEDDPTKMPAMNRHRFALHSLVTGEARWGAEIDETTELVRSLFGHQGGFAVDERAGLFALHLDGVWLVYSLATGLLERTLHTGPFRRGVFLADGRFVLAHDTELWLWERPAPRLRPHLVPAVASDGSQIIAHLRDAPAWRRLDVDRASESQVACLTDFAFADWSVGTRGAVAVDRRGRVLAVDVHGTACLSEVADETHRLDIPAKATAAALAELEDSFAVGLVDGTVLLWSDREHQPQRWQLGAAIVRLWGSDDGAFWIAHTGASQVFALRRGVATPTLLGDTHTLRGIPIALNPRRSAAALVLEGDEALVLYEASSDRTVRDPLTFPATSAVAYSPSGERLAVTLAGRKVRILTDPYEPSREIDLPEDGCGVGFLAEDELAVVGQFGSLIRVDLVLGEAALIQREWTQTRQPTMQILVRPDGQIMLFEPLSLEIHPAPTVPKDSAGLGVWLAGRIR
jgi:hypothetical protein